MNTEPGQRAHRAESAECGEPIRANKDRKESRAANQMRRAEEQQSGQHLCNNYVVSAVSSALKRRQ